MHLNADCMIIRVYFPSQPVDCLKENSQITICWQSMVVRDTWEQYVDLVVLHPVWTVSCKITPKCWGCKPIYWLVVLPLENKSKFCSKEVIETFSIRVFTLTANLKWQLQVRRLAFDVYGFYHFSYTSPTNWRGCHIEFPDNCSVWFSNGNKKSYFHSFTKKIYLNLF